MTERGGATSGVSRPSALTARAAAGEAADELGRLAVVQDVRRRPVWSGGVTTRLAAFIPVRRHTATLALIKALHTIIFASVGGAIALFVWDGLRQRPGSRAAIALGVVLTESALYVSNNQVCPLTPLAEELGAERGSVADIFLPDWLARRIPLIGGSALLLGLALHAWAWLRRRPARPALIAMRRTPPGLPMRRRRALWSI